jgi:hypothetical protein
MQVLPYQHHYHQHKHQVNIVHKYVFKHVRFHQHHQHHVQAHHCHGFEEMQ